MAFEIVLDAPFADEDLRDKISAASLVYAADAEETTDAQDIVAAAQSDYKRLVGLLYENGYFGPVVSIKVNGQEAALISPFSNISTVSQVRLSIHPGQRFKFGRAQITPQAPDTELPKEFAPQEPASLSVIQNAAHAGVDGWRNDGHAKANVSGQSITADHRKHEVDVDLTLNPGPKVTFGDLNYAGVSAVREKRVREIADLPTGETFDPEEAKRVATRLRRTDVFKSVDLREAEEIGPDETLDMDLALVDDLPRRFGFGAELESRDGVSLSGYWLHRNLLGGAESLRFDASIDNIGAQSGGTDWRLATLYTRPATLRSDTDLTIGLEIKQEDEDLYFLRQFGARVGFVRYHSERFETRFGFGALVSEVDDNFGHRHFSVYGLPVGLTWDQRDNIANPTRGYYIDADVFPYAGFSDADPGILIKADLRGYQGFGADNGFIAAGRLQLGSVIGPSLAGTPPDFLFYTGGGGTVRGQPYQSNFVTVNGIDSGGLSFIGLSGEMRVKVTSHITTVAFYDAGFVGETSNIAGPGNWQAGAGMGLRYNTGVGPLRVDLAAPVSGGTGDGLQLYIGIGHTF
ncbi:BamA/TamA family outer membrane protein [Shimia sp.]|uniref:autotransporter assembly complex protein TamA n=1 Tax=Shimia sp. TaxID=1954381 RepID=UPI0032983ABD